jgi:hypothetical protein
MQRAADRVASSPPAQNIGLPMTAMRTAASARQSVYSSTSLALFGNRQVPLPQTTLSMTS